MIAPACRAAGYPPVELDPVELDPVELDVDFDRMEPALPDLVGSDAPEPVDRPEPIEAELTEPAEPVEELERPAEQRPEGNNVSVDTDWNLAENSRTLPAEFYDVDASHSTLADPDHQASADLQSSRLLPGGKSEPRGLATPGLQPTAEFQQGLDDFKEAKAAGKAADLGNQESVDLQSSRLPPEAAESVAAPDVTEPARVPEVTEPVQQRDQPESVQATEQRADQSDPALRADQMAPQAPSPQMSDLARPVDTNDPVQAADSVEHFHPDARDGLRDQVENPDTPSSRIPDLEIPDLEIAELGDGADLDARRFGEVGEPEASLTAQQSADLQSSRCPTLLEGGDDVAHRDGAEVLDHAGPEPFYREVHLTHVEIAGIEAEVDKRVADGDWDPGDRQGLVDAAKDIAFAAKARDCEFFFLDRLGTIESTMYNATPAQWYGQGAESRLFEVAPSPDTTYYVGHAAPQGGAQGLAADLLGGGQQAFIPNDTDRSGWEMSPVARSVNELGVLPTGSAIGYDDAGDILVAPDAAHAEDVTVAVHTADQANPFQSMDRADQARHGPGWNGPIVDRFAGSIEERVTPGAASATPIRTAPAAEPAVDETSLHGPLVSDHRDSELVRDDSVPRSVLEGLSNSEVAQTAVECVELALEVFGVKGVEIQADQVAGSLAHIAGTLLARTERQNPSPISDDRIGPLIS